MEKKSLVHSFVNINERKRITLDGIVNIAKFDERGVSLISECGRIEIEGEGLKILSLEKDGGVIDISGKIEGVFYEREKPNVGFLKKLFG